MRRGRGDVPRAGLRLPARGVEPARQDELRPADRGLGPVPHRRGPLPARIPGDRPARVRRVPIPRRVERRARGVRRRAHPRLPARRLLVRLPLARGGGALLAAIAGVLFLADTLSGLAWLAIAVVVGGLASLVRPGVSRMALLWAGLTAAMIGTCTTLDAAGARRSSGLGYGIAIVLGAGLVLSAVIVASGRAGRLAPAVQREWPRFLVGGVCSTLAYSMVLAAARLAPVGYVAALRESSVILGAGAGWLFLHERLGRARVASALVVTAGLVLLIVWQ